MPGAPRARPLRSGPTDSSAQLFPNPPCCTHGTSREAGGTPPPDLPPWRLEPSFSSPRSPKRSSLAWAHARCRGDCPRSRGRATGGSAQHSVIWGRRVRFRGHPRAAGEVRAQGVAGRGDPLGSLESPPAPTPMLTARSLTSGEGPGGEGAAGRGRGDLGLRGTDSKLQLPLSADLLAPGRLREARVPSSEQPSRLRISVPSAHPGAHGASAFYSPPAFVWVPAPTTGRGGIWSRARAEPSPSPRHPALRAPGPRVRTQRRAELPARCRLRDPLPGAFTAASPPAGSAGWYNRAPQSNGRGSGGAATPSGQNRPLPSSQPGPPPRFPRFPRLCVLPAWAAGPARPDTRGHPRGSSGGSRQTQALGSASSSSLPLWHQNPEPCQLGHRAFLQMTRPADSVLGKGT